MTEQQTMSTEDTVATAVLTAQMAIIDSAVRESRRQGWCTEFENVMGRLFPDGPPDGSREFVDSDGLSCRGYGRDGFTPGPNGTDAEGYTRDGFNEPAPYGRDRDGYDREGYSRYNVNREGYDREGYNAAGFNRDGVNREGVSRDSEEYRARFRYDASGMDADGFNRNGTDGYGLTRAQRADASRYMYEADDSGVWDIDGVGPDGRDRRGRMINRERYYGYGRN